MHQVALAPRLAYSRRLLEETAAELKLHIESRGRHPSLESERTLLFCREAIRCADARLRIHSMVEIPGAVPPAIWVLRAASAQLAAHLPGCSARLCELAVHLGSVVMDAALLAGVDVRYRGSESGRMLDSAHSAAEAGLRKTYPDMERVHALRR